MITKLIKETTPLANKIYADLENNEELLNALEWHWVNGDKPMSTPYWADKIGHMQLDNFIFALSEADWIISRANPIAKWGEFKINSAKIDLLVPKAEQQEYKTRVRIKKYAMRSIENTATDLVKTATGVKATGLVRKGFMLCSNLEFQLDTAYLSRYYDAIRLNLTKSMDKIIEKHPSLALDSTNYKVIAQELLDYYIFNPNKKYNLEGNVSDSRGRAIYIANKRIGNPISNKDFRACMVVPTPKLITIDDKEALAEIYLFIAELAPNINANSWGHKAIAGKFAYHRKTLHSLDLELESDRKNLHENIWLERIYGQLDELFENGKVLWNVPIELDATMSLAQVVGILTNDARLLNKTNVINKEELLDAWFVEGVPRLHTKTVGTPIFYGSAQSATKLLKSKKLTAIQELHQKANLEHRLPTAEELKEAKLQDRKYIKILNKEFNTGAFSVIKGFKDFLIQNANVNTPTFKVKIWNDEFEVDVNKFKPAKAITNAYSIWDSEKKVQVRFLNHTVQTVPDYDRFRLYFPTGLVHNLDSQLEDGTLYMLIKTFGEFAIGIHDATIALPGSKTRAVYRNLQNTLRENRVSILADYRKSIGATTSASDIAWAMLMAKTEQLCSAVPFEESALK